MPNFMSSQQMLRLGLAMAGIGVFVSVLGSAITVRILDALPLAWEVLDGAIFALQQFLFVGGILMAIGSIMVRHFEILEDEVRGASSAGSAGPGQQQG